MGFIGCGTERQIKIFNSRQWGCRWGCRMRMIHWCIWTYFHFDLSSLHRNCRKLLESRVPQQSQWEFASTVVNTTPYTTRIIQHMFRKYWLLRVRLIVEWSSFYVKLSLVLNSILFHPIETKQLFVLKIIHGFEYSILANLQKMTGSAKWMPIMPGMLQNDF